MRTKKNLQNDQRSGTWLWQLGIIVPEGSPVEYPICPFCSTSPFREHQETEKLPGICPECGARLKLEK